MVKLLYEAVEHHHRCQIFRSHRQVANGRLTMDHSLLIRRLFYHGAHGVLGKREHRESFALATS